MPARSKDLRRKLDRLGEIPGDLDESGNEEIAEAVAFQAFPGGESMTEEPGDQMFVFGESHHAIAQIAGRQHIKATAQPST